MDSVTAVFVHNGRVLVRRVTETSNGPYYAFPDAWMSSDDDPVDVLHRLVLPYDFFVINRCSNELSPGIKTSHWYLCSLMPWEQLREPDLEWIRPEEAVDLSLPGYRQSYILALKELGLEVNHAAKQDRTEACYHRPGLFL